MCYSVQISRVRVAGLRADRCPAGLHRLSPGAVQLRVRPHLPHQVGGPSLPRHCSCCSLDTAWDSQENNVDLNVTPWPGLAFKCSVQITCLNNIEFPLLLVLLSFSLAPYPSLSVWLSPFLSLCVTLSVYLSPFLSFYVSLSLLSHLLPPP